MYLVIIVDAPQQNAPGLVRRQRPNTGAVSIMEDVHQTEAALRRAVKSRDEVLRVVSHDLRDPLQCIALTAQQKAAQQQPAPAATPSPPPPPPPPPPSAP